MCERWLYCLFNHRENSHYRPGHKPRGKMSQDLIVFLCQIFPLFISSRYRSHIGDDERTPQILHQQVSNHYEMETTARVLIVVLEVIKNFPSVRVKLQPEVAQHPVFTDFYFVVQIQEKPHLIIEVKRLISVQLLKYSVPHYKRETFTFWHFGLFLQNHVHHGCVLYMKMISNSYCTQWLLWLLIRW